MCVFGSMARGDNHEGSDVDIFVEMPPKTEGNEINIVSIITATPDEYAERMLANDKSVGRTLLRISSAHAEKATMDYRLHAFPHTFVFGPDRTLLADISGYSPEILNHLKHLFENPYQAETMR